MRRSSTDALILYHFFQLFNSLSRNILPHNAVLGGIPDISQFWAKSSASVG